MGKNSNEITLSEARKQIEELQKQIETQNTINTTLCQISEAVQNSNDLNDLYSSIHKLLNSVMFLPNFYIAIYDKEPGEIKFPYFKDEFGEPRIIKVDDSEHSQSLTRSVIFEKKSYLYIKEMPEVKEQEDGVIGPTPVIWAGVPLMIDNDSIGALVVQHYTKTDDFTNDDMQLLEAVSGQIAMAIERKKKNEIIKQHEIQIKKMSDQTEGFSSVAALILSVKDEKILFNQIGKAIVEYSDYNSLMVSYFKKASPFRDIITFEGYDKEDIDKIKAVELPPEFFLEFFEIGEQLGQHSFFISHHISQNTDIGVSAVYSDAYVASDKEDAWHPEDFLFVKMMDENDNLIGVISVDNPKSGRIPTKETIKQLEIFSSLISQIIILKRIQKELRGHKENLEELVADRTKELTVEIIEREKAERALSRAQNYISNIVDSMPSMLIGVDSTGIVTHWNKAAENATGIKADEAHGNIFTNVLPQMKSEMYEIEKSIKTKKVISQEKRPHKSENGTYFEDVVIYPLTANGVEGAVIRIDDVTDKIRLEEMIIQSEKMLSVGGLAAGMAHEINNPMAGIIQTAAVISNRLTNIEMKANLKVAEELGITMDNIKLFLEKREILRMLTTITESGRRIVDIVDNMLSFARKSDDQFSFHVLGELIDKSLELAATDFDLKKKYDFKMLEIKKEYDGNVPLVPCEAAKIQQVLLNILRNGAQAMQEAGIHKPMFTIRTNFNQKKQMACIEIKDNGPGMDKATCKRVFEPFYSTKSVGVGTGLGLSVSYFIITENHGGELIVESSPGLGAKFIIRLPLEREKQNINS
ncbi:MAG: GAF domain-containing protein [Desulfobacteraceae bacterium]|nr:GAF domain-containing protein [Desulfobacteraceae bacterium]